MHNMIQYKFMMHSFQLTLVEVCLSFFEFAPMKSCLLDLDSIINMVHALACTIEWWSTWEVWRAHKKHKELPEAIAEGNSSFLSALQTSHMLHNSIVHS